MNNYLTLIFFKTAEQISSFPTCKSSTFFFPFTFIFSLIILSASKVLQTSIHSFASSQKMASSFSLYSSKCSEVRSAQNSPLAKGTSRDLVVL